MCGGPNFYHPHTLAQTLNEHAKTLPRVITNITDADAPGGKFSYDPDADHIVDDLLHRHLAERDLRRALVAKILLASPDGKEVKETKRLTKAQVATVLLRPDVATSLGCPGYTVLNTLPFPEALKLYLAGTKG